MLSLADLESSARERIPGPLWDFLSGGSGREETLAGNLRALERVRLVPRVLADASACDAGTTFFGSTATMPVGIAPMAYHQLLHPDGELATARAAASHGVPLTISTLSSRRIEAVTAAGASIWFQLYWLRDERLTFELVQRAEDAGCRAVVLTVDVPWMGRRLRDTRNGYSLPPGVQAANLPSSLAALPDGEGSAVAAHTAEIVRSSLTWSDVERLRARTRLPVVLKGVLAPEDASRAVECGVDGLVVSNHGGRQLDGAVASVDALEAVAAEVDRRCVVLLDGGVRSGVDVLKALALGADGVLLGRPVLWGLAVGGATGVGHVLDLVRAELRDALGLAGCRTLEDARRLTARREPSPA